MDTVETVFKFISSYPVWARALLVGLSAAICLILLFAREPPVSPINVAKSQGHTAANPSQGQTVPHAFDRYLHIDQVTLYPEASNEEIQVIAHVNGSQYKFPSVPGVDWVKVGPDMDRKIIALPRAREYNIRFEVRIRNKEVLSNLDEVFVREGMVSGSELNSNALFVYSWSESAAGTYKLYEVHGGVRGASVRAVIGFELNDIGR